MPKVSAEHMQARREQILDAAVNCFIRNGFHQTSMDDICAEAGLSVGAIYLHFKSKDEIVEAAWKNYLASREDAYQRSYRAGDVRAAGKVASERFVGRLASPVPDKDWQLWLQLVSEAARNPAIRESLKQSWKMNDEWFAEVGRRYEAETGVPVDREKLWLIARIFVAIHDGLVLQKILDPDQDTTRIFRAFSHVFFPFGVMSDFTNKQAEDHNDDRGSSRE